MSIAPSTLDFISITCAHNNAIPLLRLGNDWQKSTAYVRLLSSSDHHNTLAPSFPAFHLRTHGMHLMAKQTVSRSSVSSCPSFERSGP